jgi:hypothetical protein
MVLIGVFIFISVLALITVRWISVIEGFWKSVWWVSTALSLFRIACLWIGYLSMKTEGFGQVLGYFMLMCTLPEALLARQIQQQPILWVSLMSLLVPIGSFLWVFFLACVAARNSQKKSL